MQNNLNENLHGGAAGAFSKEAAAGMKTLAFTSIIDIWELKERRDKREALAQSSVKNICQTMQNVQNEDKPDIKPLLSKARKIKQNVYPILNRFENVYEDANDIVGRFSRVYHADIFPSNFIKNEDKIIELDSNKKPIREAQFEGDMPHIIKDYKKSAIMIYEAEPYDLKSEKLDVYLNCDNMDDDNFFRADEFFSFRSGKLYRYGRNCLTDFDLGRFESSEIFTFNRNVFESYDKSFVISGGTEYSNEFFGFKLRPGAEYYELEGNLTPARYVKNKVCTNGIIIYSTDEILFSWHPEITAASLNAE